MAYDKYSEQNLQNFWNKVNKTDGCWLWTGCKDNDGYGKFGVASKILGAHRVSLEIHLQRNIRPGLVVAHTPEICHNPSCVNPEHLREATYTENRLDMHKDGTINAKLTAAQVLEIRASNKTRRDLAAEYAVSREYISKIITRIKWKYLPPA